MTGEYCCQRFCPAALTSVTFDEIVMTRHIYISIESRFSLVRSCFFFPSLRNCGIHHSGRSLAAYFC